LEHKCTKKAWLKWWKNWGKIAIILKVLSGKNGRFAHLLKGFFLIKQKPLERLTIKAWKKI
jgi:hypothetical protein